ncbi:hypothetical protein ACFE04_026746 [Oxalis oulophora]
MELFLSSVESIDVAVKEIMKIHRSLPSRPGIEEVEAARDLVANVEKEEQSRLESVARQIKSPDVPQDLFIILQDMEKSLVYYHAKQQKTEALKFLDLEALHHYFDDCVQRAASQCSSSFTPSLSLSPSTTTNSYSYSNSNSNGKELLFTRDDTYIVQKNNNKSSSSGSSFFVSPSTKPQILDSTLLKPIATASGHEDGDKLSLIKLASLIEVSSKKASPHLNLQNNLSDQIQWLPDSIGKLSSLISLDLSENRLVALPPTIGGLSSLTRLDLHSNKITELPEAIGNLLALVFLDLRANQLSTLPPTFGRLISLEELDLSSNQLSVLPDSIGSLVSLKILNVETNDLEELPHTIGQCYSLKELRTDYNRLKALPEAVGKITSLEVLSVRYNNIKQLPTTMSSLANLKELDVSFNELESVPESLCFATTLVKMNIGNNFADMRSLPRSIGNLENLEELDISNNQIRVLPDSFRMLTKLRILRVEENPLEVPPMHIADKGAQAVVQCMAELVEKRDIKAVPVKQKKSWAQICFLSRSNKRKRNGSDYVKAR